MFLFQRYRSARAPGQVWLCREEEGRGGAGQVDTRGESSVSTTSGWIVAHASTNKEEGAWLDRHKRVKSRVVVARAKFWYVDFLHQKHIHLFLKGLTSK